MNTDKEMYVLPDLNPDTKVEFSVGAVGVCGAVGVLSTTTEYTNAVRKSRYTIMQNTLSYWLIVICDLSP